MNVIIHKLVEIFKKSIREGKSPKRWLETKIVFIPKPGKLDYSDPKSLRPISLSTFLFKGLEKCIHWYITRTALIQNKFHKNLYSYREGISTEDVLHKVIHKIEKALEKKEFAIALFMDISAAFSTANISGMIKNMQRKGIQPGIINWITDALTNRQAMAILNGVTVLKVVDRGMPQGGILSADYWNSNMDDLLERFPERESGDVNAFADDILDLVIGIDERTMVNILQQDIKKMVSWAKEHNLTFSPEKTKVMLFTRKTKKFIRPKLFIEGMEIEWVTSFKYLGITLDSKLNFLTHVENITKRASMTMAQCKRMIGKSWGLKPKICRWVYTSLIRPILTYGCAIWINSINKESTHLKKLEKVQRQGCLSILSAMSSTPTAGLEVILDIRPIEIHLQELAVSCYLRLKKNGNWKPIPGEVLKETAHSNIILKVVNEIEGLEMPVDKLLNKAFIVSDFSTMINDRTDMESIRIKLTPGNINTINCFTDGSKTDQGSGCAFIFRGDGVKAQDYLSLGKLSTVFQTEIFAIGEACRRMVNMNINGKTINIYVDSQAAIKALANYIITSRGVAETKTVLNKLCTMPCRTFRK